MDQERKEQNHRLNNRDKSDASKIAWKRNHASYMTGVKKRERKAMNRSFYDICREIDQAELDKNTDFETEAVITLNNIAGGIAMTINKDNGNVSFSTSLQQTGSGQYRLTDFDDETLQNLYKALKDELLELCKNFDDGIQQIIARHGLNSTK